MINVMFVGGRRGVIMVQHIVAYEEGDPGIVLVKLASSSGEDLVSVHYSYEDFDAAVRHGYKQTFIRVAGHL